MDRAAEKAQGRWSFSLPATYFGPGERHVRVRGTAVWATNDRDQLWQVALTLPTSTQVRYESGTLLETFAQAPGVCRVGKVMSRRRVVTPEISGVTALYNVSPNLFYQRPDPRGVPQRSGDRSVTLRLV